MMVVGVGTRSDARARRRGEKTPPSVHPAEEAVPPLAELAGDLVAELVPRGEEAAAHDDAGLAQPRFLHQRFGYPFSRGEIHSFLTD